MVVDKTKDTFLRTNVNVLMKVKSQCRFNTKNNKHLSNCVIQNIRIIKSLKKWVFEKRAFARWKWLCGRIDFYAKLAKNTIIVHQEYS